MGQLTLSRFRGDTTFGLVARIFSTFFGGLVGTVIWCVPCASFTCNVAAELERLRATGTSRQEAARETPTVSRLSWAYAYPFSSSDACTGQARRCSTSSYVRWLCPRKPADRLRTQFFVTAVLVSGNEMPMSVELSRRMDVSLGYRLLVAGHPLPSRLHLLGYQCGLGWFSASPSLRHG